MAASIVKCVHCSWIDFLESGPKRCPKCGSVTRVMEYQIFDKESITTEVIDTRLRSKKVDISFHTFSEQFNAIIGNALEFIYPVDSIRNRVEFMMKVYVWGLLEKAPILWRYVDIPISGLKELMLLNEKKFQEQLTKIHTDIETVEIKGKTRESEIKRLEDQIELLKNQQTEKLKKLTKDKTNEITRLTDQLKLAQKTYEEELYKQLKNKDNEIKELQTKIKELEAINNSLNTP